MSPPRQAVTPIPKGNHTVFACDSSTTTALFLAGTFNNWNSKSTPMTRDNRGRWTVHTKKFIARIAP
jgi:1,4-alpha-glucan branching enzyme